MRTIAGRIPTSYAIAAERLIGRDVIHLGGNTHVVRCGPQTIGLRLHETIIVRYSCLLGNETIMLDTGGWRTVTTKARMNAALAGKGWKITSRDGTWFVISPNRQVEVSFFDGMVLS